MKIVVRTKDDINSFKPRDVRNYIASICSKSKDIILSHKHTAPQLIYAKPYRYGFDIIDYRNRTDLMDEIETTIKKHTQFYGTEITAAKIKNSQYIIPAKQTMRINYYTRTPVIMTVNSKEFNYIRAITSRGSKEDMEHAFSTRLNNDIMYQIKQYFGIDYQVNVKISLTKIRTALIKYKQDEYFIAAITRFTSNYMLPDFIGYKTGLGWGQIVKENSTAGSLL